MTGELLDEEAAARFCKLPLTYFKNLRRTGRGPTFLRPSPRVTLYRTSDLETWMGSWVTVKPANAKTAISHRDT
jgi:hypothetical protein